MLILSFYEEVLDYFSKSTKILDRVEINSVCLQYNFYCSRFQLSNFPVHD